MYLSVFVVSENVTEIKRERKRERGKKEIEGEKENDGTTGFSESK